MLFAGRSRLLGFVFLFAGLFSVPLSVGAQTDEGQSADRSRQATIHVTGEGSVQATPDMAEATFGVVSEASTVSEAVSANNEATAKVIEALKAGGVAAKDLQTSSFDIMPLSRHDPSGQRQPEITGYRVSNQLTVKIRQLPDLGALLDAGVQAGANQIHGIQMTVSEPGEQLDEARLKAMEDARRKAELLARAAGARLGRALEISESMASPPRPYAQGLRMMASAEASSVPIETGEQSLTARVSVTYALEPGE